MISAPRRRPDTDRARDASRTRLFYHDAYVYDVLEAGRRHTFDIERPRRIRDALIATGLVGPSDFSAAPAASEAELLLVHTPEYLAEIRRPETLAKLLLLDPAHPSGDRLLEPFLFAAGGTIVAARTAATERTVAINLGGGFHHAQADKGGGLLRDRRHRRRRANPEMLADHPTAKGESAAVAAASNGVRTCLDFMWNSEADTRMELHDLNESERLVLVAALGYAIGSLIDRHLGDLETSVYVDVVDEAGKAANDG